MGFGQETSAEMHTADFFIIAGYLLALVVIGLAVAGREKSADSYFVAGCSVPGWAGRSVFRRGTASRHTLWDWLAAERQPHLDAIQLETRYEPFKASSKR
jgi:hypothetical protein